MADEKTISVDDIEGGIPGLQEHFTIVFGTTDGPLGPVQGENGMYRATLTLHRPAFSLTEDFPQPRHSFESGLRGDSHLAISAPAYTHPQARNANELQCSFALGEVRYDFRAVPNDAGYLGKLIFDSVPASSFDDAYARVFRAAGVFLSDAATQLDIPLRVFQVDLVEIATGSQRVTHVNHFDGRPCAMTGILGSEELRAYASMYREGLNSNSLLYQFLCFYKIVEGVFGRRKNLAREAKRTGKPYATPLEVVPRDPGDFEPWLNTLYSVRPEWRALDLDVIFQPEALGRAFTDLVGERKPLTIIRNKIGHALTSSSGRDVVNLDEADLHFDVHRWLPLLKCIARKMLRDDFGAEFLPHLSN